ncbi:class I SAM-dependent methyltransferase [Pseudonocardia sp. TRM90224]|uniref:class I SAM-dependent methyltransferase n=1 Tax=Pseudonocardia sp. TRM90224 TaxID=2812678 RepID=UPI001E2B1DFB|nr:class I SAM-dependent methyltransferase [Pseudonocardia sp. TRM90224]
MADYFAVNRDNWDERAPAHAASPGYSVRELIADPERLSGVVRFDVPRLGDIAGLRGVHLQCHIGTDTISLARLGARMTGLDFSSAAVAEGKRIAAAAGADVEFVESDLYGAPDVLPVGAFDLVFTGIGALCWLPDIRRWAGVVATLLKPGGRLFLREGHPMLWAIDDEADALLVGYPYFETPEPATFEDESSYVPTAAPFVHTTSHSWNHGLGEIVTALLEAGMTITQLVEHDTVPWDALPGKMVEGADGEYRLREHPERLPLTYTLQATKA